MLRQVLSGTRMAVQMTVSRNISVTAPVCKAVQLDPIQQLFIDQIRDYKKQSAGGKLVGATPDVEKQLQDQLDKVSRTFGATQEDFSKFPTFSFEDLQLQEVGIEYTQKTEEAQHNEAEEGEVDEMDISPHH